MAPSKEQLVEGRPVISLFVVLSISKFNFTVLSEQSCADDKDLQDDALLDLF